MIFYRSPASTGPGPALGTVRALILASLLAYPAGGLILALGPDGRGGLFLFEVAGLALIVLSFLAAAPVLGSWAQRVVGETADQLDEYELQLRNKAMASAYATFAALTCLAVIYAALASDFGWWTPASFDEFNALFWGVFLYAALLPTAFLTWRLEADTDALGDPRS